MKMNSKKCTPRLIIIKLLKTKGKNTESSEKEVTPYLQGENQFKWQQNSIRNNQEEITL